MESLFMNFAECLGVKLFKKYWFINGSYWNKNHMNPKNTYELSQIITFTYCHGKNHFICWSIETILALFTFKTLNEPLPYTLSVGILHLYAIMVQLYNNILAKRALNKLLE